MQQHGSDSCKYEQWGRQTHNMLVKGKEKKVTKTERIVHEEDINKVFEKFKDQIKPFGGPLFRAQWQQNQLKQAKLKMRPHSAILIMDFAENYKCTEQDEAQAAHWSQKSATIHPIMGFINSSEIPGPFTHKEAIIMISNDLKHDVYAVKKFNDLALQHLKQKFTIQHVRVFTDCAASQYRCSKSLAEISMLHQNHISISHN